MGYRMTYRSNIFVLVAACLGIAQTVTYVEINLKQVKRNISEEFLSVTLDMSIIRHHWINFNFSSPKLHTLAKGLSPAYLRVGGTSADFLYFSPGKTPYKSLTISENLSSLYLSCEERTNFTLYGDDWDKLNNFAKNVGWKILFDLNVLTRRGKEWDERNALEMLKYSHERGYQVDWQLGNEPDAFPHALNRSVSSSALARSFLKLRHLLDTFPLYKHSLLVGPDVTRPKVGRRHPSKSIIYLKSFIENMNKSLDVVSWHHYYFDGRTAVVSDFLNSSYLNKLPVQIGQVYKVLEETGLQRPVWLTETSSAWGGGAPDLSDSYVAGFIWLDKLGISAAQGVSMVMRQSFYHGHYALIDENLDPLPDYWLSLIFKRLVGREVLMTSIYGSGNDSIRLYAGCTRQLNNAAFNEEKSSGVVLYGMNIKKLPMTVTLQRELWRSDQHHYHLQPCIPSLTSKCVMLNGRELKLENGGLPPLRPQKRSPATVIQLSPFSISFWVFPSVSTPVCR